MKNRPGYFMLFVFMLIAMCLSGCQSTIEWPDGTGYVTRLRRPSSPHDVKQTSTTAEIIAVSADGSGRFLMSANSKVEIRDSKALVIYPGAQITYLGPPDTKIQDYNGDWCVLPYGLTVRVDEYGQFIPVKYDPDLPSPNP